MFPHQARELCSWGEPNIYKILHKLSCFCKTLLRVGIEVVCIPRATRQRVPSSDVSVSVILWSNGSTYTPWVHYSHTHDMHARSVSLSSHYKIYAFTVQFQARGPNHLQLPTSKYHYYGIHYRSATLRRAGGAALARDHARRTYLPHCIKSVDFGPKTDIASLYLCVSAFLSAKNTYIKL